MLTNLARFAMARPRTVLVAALLLMIICGGFGATVKSHMVGGGYLTSELESVRANDFIEDNFPGGNPNLIVMITAEGGVNSPEARSEAQRITDELRADSTITGVRSYWTTVTERSDLATALRSKDSKRGLIMATLLGTDTQIQNRAAELTGDLSGDRDGVQVRVGGMAGTFADINHQVEKDLILAEAIAIPISGLLLVLVFGSLVAAALPIGVGLFAIAATLGILRALTTVMDVSIFALNMTSALGLALAIDYSLFLVSRYREELAAGRDTRAAVLRAVQTAGRTVVFSGLTVALALAALAVFPQPFFKSFAFAGVAVVAAAVGASVLLLPAALVLLGDRINALDLRKPLRRALGRPEPTPQRPEDSGWYRLVMWVMRRSVPVAVVTGAVLLALGSPFLGAHFGSPDDRVIGDFASSRQVGDALREDFNADMASSAVLVLPDFQGTGEQIGTYAAALSKVPDVPAVMSSAGVYVDGTKMAAGLPEMAGPAGTYLSVGTRLAPSSVAGKEQLATLREVPAPGEVLFGGAAALDEDTMDSVIQRLPLAVGLIAVITLILLFLFTGSVVLPVKALLLNLLSVTATFGAMIWIFQDGHLSGLLGFTPTGTIDLFMPILMFCLAFGMSMDYEVFLLSRIREEWLASDRSAAANARSVALGVARTGRIFTAAAGLMAVVLLAVATSQVAAMKLFGIGLALAIVADATVIRGLLAPALMRMMSTANWWAPKPLAALYKRIGLEEEGAEPERPAPTLEKLGS
ncbi:MMPL family transporter [Nocardia otitidiscaviarum]|uniref:MMPL family transporter n=1 Tax=Nocardia otitidiscaviarum TaxID=1823 RepID=A0A516NVI9_9NOCA|nr:MMPL family transporter [Nocardia otitidiscaviarum]MCP9622400.1 MMPL family transporter [Nocardia otitidiscaviarum]QDP82925.1 MMPL family transporter [Nocardia otitidiscaviarum]